MVAVTEELAAAENRDCPLFAPMFGVRTPKKWPPPLNDAESVKWAWPFARENPDGAGFGMWYVVLTDGSGSDVGEGDHSSVSGGKRDIGSSLLIGTCGFRGMPSDDGTVETGYSILEEHQVLDAGTGGGVWRRAVRADARGVVGGPRWPTLLVHRRLRIE
ncbi:MAG TPA: hypothetical protein VJW75_10850 [Candidatus Eisenbacteria bacterium]|nr:hypothetical protein [Candidatus Eisenbacteria bacterium]